MSRSIVPSSDSHLGFVTDDLVGKATDGRGKDPGVTATAAPQPRSSAAAIRNATARSGTAVPGGAQHERGSVSRPETPVQTDVVHASTFAVADLAANRGRESTRGRVPGLGSVGGSRNAGRSAPQKTRRR
jgi:hypothetical protein